MNAGAVDEAIERYVKERMTKGRKHAQERFLAYAHMRFRGPELARFLEKTSGMARYYTDFFKVLVNPFKGPEMALFASFATVAVYSVFLMLSEESRNLGIFLFSGGVVNGGAIARNALRKWCDLDVLAAVYRELALLAEEETAKA